MKEKVGFLFCFPIVTITYSWDECAYWAAHISELELGLDMAVLISRSALMFTQYLLFVTATAEDPALQRYDVTQRITV